MGIETEQRLKRLEQRLAALEGVVAALRAGTPAAVIAEPTVSKPPAKAKKIATAASGGAKRRTA
jgi:hypothetical protein